MIPLNRYFEKKQIKINSDEFIIYEINLSRGTFYLFELYSQRA